MNYIARVLWFACFSICACSCGDPTPTEGQKIFFATYEHIFIRADDVDFVPAGDDSASQVGIAVVPLIRKKAELPGAEEIWKLLDSELGNGLNGDSASNGNVEEEDSRTVGLATQEQYLLGRGNRYLVMVVGETVKIIEVGRITDNSDVYYFLPSGQRRSISVEKLLTLLAKINGV